MGSDSTQYKDKAWVRTVYNTKTKLGLGQNKLRTKLGLGQNNTKTKLGLGQYTIQRQSLGQYGIQYKDKAWAA